MQILLSLPGNVVNENLDGFQKVLESYSKLDFKYLDNVPVTKDHAGTTVSYFGDEEWILSAYIDRKITNKDKITFSEISSFELATELKMICFSWLYTNAGRGNFYPLKPSTIIFQHSKLLQVYKFLEKMKWASISKLSHAVLFYEFCTYLTSLQYSYGNTVQIFSMLNKVQRADHILPIGLVIPTDQSTKALAIECCAVEKTKPNQFYAMPTSIMEKIYSRAIDYIEKLYPYRVLLSELIRELRINYEVGKKVVDRKINDGSWKWLTPNSADYRVEVNKAKPQSYSSIIELYLQGTPLEKHILPWRQFESWLSKIQAACYIVCAAFTGMRRSELYSLHPDSFKTRTYNGKTIHTVQSYHHKMTQGRGQLSEWVTTTIVGDAISLAEALTQYMREQLFNHPDPMKNHEASCLWLTQTKKSEAPKVIYEGHFRNKFNEIAEEAGAIVDDEALEEFYLINPNQNSVLSNKKVALGSIWPITSHQFRRTFAVFVRRHNLCSTIAVKEQFKHLDIPTSEWYEEGGAAAVLRGINTDSELSELIKNVRNEVITETVFKWYNRKDKLFGKRGLEIMKDRGSIPTEHKSWQEIHNHVKAGRIDFVGTLHSYCLAGYQCQMSKVASLANCFKCENQLIDEEQAKGWSIRHQQCIQQIKYLKSIDSFSSSIESHYLSQIKAAERVMHFFNIPFSEYKQDGGNDD